jgi:hypothetical protein
MDGPTDGASVGWLTHSTEAFMRKFWIALAVCGGAAGFLAWGTAMPTQAGLMISGSHANMSMVEQAKAKKAKAPATTCENYLLMKCCTTKGKETCTPGPM